MAQEVVSNSNLRHGQIVAEKDYLGECGVKDDVPVVGHGQIAAVY